MGKRRTTRCSKSFKNFFLKLSKKKKNFIHARKQLFFEIKISAEKPSLSSIDAIYTYTCQSIHVLGCTGPSGAWIENRWRLPRINRSSTAPFIVNALPNRTKSGVG